MKLTVLGSGSVPAHTHKDVKIGVWQFHVFQGTWRKKKPLGVGGGSLLSKLLCVFLKSQERPWCECGNTGTRSQLRLGAVKLQEGLEDSGFCFLPHWESGSWGARVWPGRSPASQASLPREQEARPRPADLLLEVRGLGRPSRPHFLQPRPTPCGPRIYGN